MIEPFLFLLTGIIGIVIIFLMIRYYRSNPFCNFFLILTLSIISFRFFIHGSYNLGLQTLLKPDRGLSSLLYLILFPCSYLYYKNLSHQTKAFNFKDLKHLIFILLLYSINSIEGLENSFIFYFGIITNLFFIILFVLFYLIVTFLMLSKKIWFRKNLHINGDYFNLVKNWTIYFFTINTLCAVMLVVSLYLEITNGVYVSGKMMAIFSLIFWLFIFFKILVSPEILFGLPTLNKTLLKFNAPLNKDKTVVIIKSNNWVLVTETKKSDQDLKLKGNIGANIERYINEVDKLSTVNLIFRNPKISQSNLAENIGVPASHVVYLFKYHSKISFSEYRTNSRVQDAILLIKGGFLSTETLESLAFKTGFASYNPFFIAFKKITTYSPQEYVKVKKS